jgi:hypothetical protein
LFTANQTGTAHKLTIKLPFQTGMGMTTDPVLLSTVTAALSFLAQAVIAGTISEAGKELWLSAKQRLGFTADPPPDELAVSIAVRLKDDPALASELAELLKSEPRAGQASLMVGRIEAGKVIVAQTLNVAGDFKM